MRWPAVSRFSVCIALAACSLPDRTLVEPRTIPAQTPPSGIVAAIDQRTPLVTIDYTTPDPDYRAALRDAIAQARQQRPNAAFDVVTVIPTQGKATGMVADQISAAEALRPNALGVARELTQLGIPHAKLSLTARTDPGVTVREIRIYVR